MLRLFIEKDFKLNIHRWFNITNINPDDGLLEPKRYNVDFASQ